MSTFLSWLRSATTVLLAVVCLTLATTGGEAQELWWRDAIVRDALFKHFSAREWESYRIDAGFMLRCTAKSCADPAVVTVQVQETSPALVENIKAGGVKDALMSRAAALSGVKGVEFRIEKVEVQEGDVPQFFMTYSCNCGGSKKHGITKVAVTGQGTVTVNSLALKSDNAVRHGSKMLEILVDRAKR